MNVSNFTLRENDHTAQGEQHFYYRQHPQRIISINIKRAWLTPSRLRQRPCKTSVIITFFPEVTPCPLAENTACSMCPQAH